MSISKIKFIHDLETFQVVMFEQQHMHTAVEYFQGLIKIIGKFNKKGYIYIIISIFTSVCPSSGGGIGGVPLSSFKFLQSCHKVSLIKVAWYMLRVKNMHSRSPSDP